MSPRRDLGRGNNRSRPVILSLLLVSGLEAVKAPPRIPLRGGATVLQSDFVVKKVLLNDNADSSAFVRESAKVVCSMRAVGV